MKKAVADFLNNHLVACGFTDMRFRWDDAPGGAAWDIVPTREAAKACQGSRSAMRSFSDRRAQVVTELRSVPWCATLRASRHAP